MKKSLGYLRCLALFLVLLSAAFAETPHVKLAGHVPSKAVADATHMGKLEADAAVPVTFVLPLRNQKELDELIRRLYDPTDHEQYGRYLTAEEFTKRFAPSQQDYDKVVAYAKSLGLNVVGKHPNRTLLNVSGQAKAVEAAFKLNLHKYQHASGRMFYAPNTEPEVPAHIASIISGFVGLDNHAVWHTYNRRKEMQEEVVHASHASTFPSGPGGAFSPSDLMTAYNLKGITQNGAGQNVALFELASYQASDITTYASTFGLPAPKLTNVLVDGGSGAGIDPEVTLDIELVLALAPQSQVYVYEGPNSGQGVLDTYNRIATDNLAKQVSTSWGLGENYDSAQTLQAESAIFQQMAAQGQTIFAAAGDAGAYDDYPTMTLVVDDPASQPYMCGVGGTRLTVNATSGAYASEVVWNNGLGNGAGGGGVSAVWPIPTWQTNIASAYSKTNRNVPDIALNADPSTGYSIYYNGQWTIYGGTSCAAPLWAAFTALVNQKRASAQLATVGFINPTLYAIGTSTLQTTDYHDITSGNNLYYAAGVGYDNATGWGSFNGANLFNSLTQTSPDVPQVSLTSPPSGATVGGRVTVTATASDAMGIAHVDFYADSTLVTSVTTAPYVATVDSTQLPNGQHTLSAVAYNTAGNSAKSVVTVIVDNVASNKLYINAGGSAVTDTCTNVAWQADQYYSGGSTYTNSTLSTCLGVYTTERFGNFSYTIPVTNGNKWVILKFSEIYFSTVGARVFNVSINGQKVLSNLDIFKEVGFGKPLDLSFPVNVTNGTIQVTFTAVTQNPQLNGLEILSQ